VGAARRLVATFMFRGEAYAGIYGEILKQSTLLAYHAEP
jgi:hypothetical protein